MFKISLWTGVTYTEVIYWHVMVTLSRKSCANDPTVPIVYLRRRYDWSTTKVN